MTTILEMLSASVVILNERHLHTMATAYIIIVVVIVILNEKDSLNLGATLRLMMSVRLVLMVVFWRIMHTFA